MTDVSIVHLPYCSHLALGEGREPRRRRVLTGLLAIFGARDDAGDRIEHQYPAKRQLSRRSTGGHQLSQGFDRLQPSLIGNARKGLAGIEGLTIAIETAMIVGGKLTIAAQLAGEQAARERYPGDDCDVALPCEVEEAFSRTLAKHVEDDLHAGDRIIERLDRLFYLFYAYAVAP